MSSGVPGKTDVVGSLVINQRSFMEKVLESFVNKKLCKKDNRRVVDYHYPLPPSCIPSRIFKQTKCNLEGVVSYVETSFF